MGVSLHSSSLSKSATLIFFCDRTVLCPYLHGIQVGPKLASELNHGREAKSAVLAVGVSKEACMILMRMVRPVYMRKNVFAICKLRPLP